MWNSPKLEGLQGLFAALAVATLPGAPPSAALEAMAYRTRDVLDSMVEQTGRRPPALRVDGGAVGNEFLMQFLADILDLPVERPAVKETTALGAAGLAGIAAGLWNDAADFVSHRTVERTFLPTMGLTEREQHYAKWQEAVKRALQWA